MTDYINRRDSIRNFERWIEDHDYIKCPKCGVMVKWEFTFFDDVGNWNYCPNCGKMMEGGAENAVD